MKQQNADGRGQRGLARDPAGAGRIRRQQERSRGSSGSPGQRDTLSGFKGTELMQVPCSGLGGRSDSHQAESFPRLPRGLWNRLTAALACFSAQGS